MKVKLSLGRMAKPLIRAARWASCLRGEEGSATLVEFAITLPILVGTLTGTCSVAMAMYSLQQLSNATSAAVQAVASGPGITTGTYNDSDPCAFAANTVTTTLSGWTKGNFSYSMTISYVASGTTTVTSATYTAAKGASFSCAGGSSELQQDYPVELTVTYAYSWLPILGFKSTTINLTSAQGASAN